MCGQERLYRGLTQLVLIVLAAWQRVPSGQ